MNNHLLKGFREEIKKIAESGKYRGVVCKPPKSRKKRKGRVG